MDTLPDEILLKLFRYLDVLDLGECVMVSKRFQRICHDRSLDYKENYLMPSLYKGSTSCYLKDLILLGEYEKAKKFYRKRWTNQWHLEDSVTFECRRRFIDRLAEALNPYIPPEQGGVLLAYAKAIEIEKTMYSIASTKQSYFHLIAESIYKYYHPQAMNLESETNKTLSFGIDQEILQHVNDTVTALPNERIKSWHDGCVSSKLRDHMVQLTVQAPLGFWSQAFILNPLYIDLISWAMNIECDFHTQATSRAEYFRLMALNIYEVQMKIVERVANQDQDDQGVLGIPVINGVPVVPGVTGVTGVQGVHSIAKGVDSAQGDLSLKEPNYNQVHIERKFVRPSNFVKGLRRKVFVFSDAHLIKEGNDLAQNPPKVCFICTPFKNILPNLSPGIKESGKPIKNKVNPQCNLCYQLATFPTSRLRRKTKPKKLLDPPSLNNVGPNRAFIGFEDTEAQCRAVNSGGAGGALAPPEFGSSVNPIPARGVRLCPPHYW